MKIAIFSDVHGTLNELKEVLILLSGITMLYLMIIIRTGLHLINYSWK